MVQEQYPLRYIEIAVTYGERPLPRTIETPFLVLSCQTVNNCIIGRLTLGRLVTVAFMVHLKMNFYSCKDEVLTLNFDLKSSRICYSESDLVEEPSPLESQRKSTGKMSTSISLDSLEDDEDDELPRELKKKIRRLKPDGNFSPIQLGEGQDLAKVVMIGPDLSNEVKEAIISYLQEHADLFA